MTAPFVASEAMARIFELGLSCETRDSFLQATLAWLRDLLACRSLGVFRSDRGRWLAVLEVGTPASLPQDLLGDAMNGHLTLSRNGWSAAPLGTPADTRDLLVAQHAPGQTALADWPRLSAAAALAWKNVRERERAQRRLQRMETIVELTGQWNQTLEMDALLRKVAEASTRLLQAERASIFLWDRPNRILVGRPALGVEGGELRLPDDRGIVGRVVQTGEPCRVGSTDPNDEVDRSVDRRLRFRTRSLVCVPMFGRRGEVLGAFELLNKRGGDFSPDDEEALRELANHATIALENSRQFEELVRARNQIADQAAAGVQLIGECPAIRALRSTIQRLAATELAVLLQGENGTGKEVVGQLVHYLSRRRNEPLVAVNCAALPDTLLESELFGHEKGAFTDARERHIGKFEMASKGTLFLDEIGDLSLAGQAKLLRVLEEKVVVRVGGSTPIFTDVRVVAATNQNLVEMVRNKRFREDLYFRLNVVTLELPPLRDRGEDVILMAEHFLHVFSTKARRKPPHLTAAARRRLINHSWPGNVRELRNLMERLAYLTSGDAIDADDLVFVTGSRHNQASAMDLDGSLSDATRVFQREYVKQQITRAGGNMTDAATRLGLHRANLYRKMRQLGMDVHETSS